MNRHRRAPLTPVVRDPEGRLRCRTCYEVIPKGRHAFCSDSCATDFRIRRRPEVAHAEFRKRYGDRCAGCGAHESEAFKLWQQCVDLLKDGPVAHLLLPWAPFELDHIRPVADGGGACGLENYRLLCHKCHGGITKKWNQERFARRTASGPWAASVRAKAGYKVELP